MCYVIWVQIGFNWSLGVKIEFKTRNKSLTIWSPFANSLLILNISHNNLDKIGAKLSNNLLSKLIASFNRLTINQSLINRIAESFPSLTDLNLAFQSDADSQLRVNLDDEQCTQLELNKCQLKYINLSGNQLCHLNRINGCPTLTTVILHSNRMSTIPLFKSCQQLQVLDISNNCFDEQLLTGIPNRISSKSKPGRCLSRLGKWGKSSP